MTDQAFEPIFAEAFVLGISEARATFPAIVKSLASGGAAAAPVFVGAHRRPQIVLLSIERYRALADMIDNFAIALEVQRRDDADDGRRLSLDEVFAAIGLTRAEVEAAIEADEPPRWWRRRNGKR